MLAFDRRLPAPLAALHQLPFDYDDGRHEPTLNAAFTEFAAKHAPTSKKSPAQITAAARAEFPDFEDRIHALCR